MLKILSILTILLFMFSNEITSIRVDQNFNKKYASIDTLNPGISKLVFNLPNLLTRYQIPVERWVLGQNGAKTINHLTKELLSGESILVEEVLEDGRRILKRCLRVVSAEIYYVDAAGISYHLVEDRQEFKNGNPPKRRSNVGSMSEKMKPNEEHPNLALVRGMQEELQINLSESQYYPDQARSKKEYKYSDAYPGLLSEYSIFKYNVRLNQDQYQPAGYQEEQKDKTTYFVWERVDAIPDVLLYVRG